MPAQTAKRKTGTLSGSRFFFISTQHKHLPEIPTAKIQKESYKVLFPQKNDNEKFFFTNNRNTPPVSPDTRQAKVSTNIKSYSFAILQNRPFPFSSDLHGELGMHQV